MNIQFILLLLFSFVFLPYHRTQETCWIQDLPIWTSEPTDIATVEVHAIHPIGARLLAYEEPTFNSSTIRAWIGPRLRGGGGVSTTVNNTIREYRISIEQHNYLQIMYRHVALLPESFAVFHARPQPRDQVFIISGLTDRLRWTTFLVPIPTCQSNITVSPTDNNIAIQFPFPLATDSPTIAWPFESDAIYWLAVPRDGLYKIDWRAGTYNRLVPADRLWGFSLTVSIKVSSNLRMIVSGPSINASIPHLVVYSLIDTTTGVYSLLNGSESLPPSSSLYTTTLPRWNFYGNISATIRMETDIQTIEFGANKQVRSLCQTPLPRIVEMIPLPSDFCLSISTNVYPSDGSTTPLLLYKNKVVVGGPVAGTGNWDRTVSSPLSVGSYWLPTPYIYSSSGLWIAVPDTYGAMLTIGLIKAIPSPNSGITTTTTTTTNPPSTISTTSTSQSTSITSTTPLNVNSSFSVEIPTIHLFVSLLVLVFFSF